MYLGVYVENKKSFLEKFHVEEYLEKTIEAGLDWKTISVLCDDYKKKWYKKYDQLTKEIVQRLNDKPPYQIRVVYGRAKQANHLAEKIIRKVGKEGKAKYFDIDLNNYREIITDLSGVRILLVRKEDWAIVDDYIRKQFKFFVEDPIAYVCYGDRHIYDKNLMRIDYTNKGYRSIHYLVKYKGLVCEIQVRTLAEEVYGEYDHMIRYPYRSDNKFLNRYNRIVSKATSELDDLISTCYSMSDDALALLADECKDDEYVDWRSVVDEAKEKQALSTNQTIYTKNVSAKSFLHNKLINR